MMRIHKSLLMYNFIIAQFSTKGKILAIMMRIRRVWNLKPSNHLTEAGKKVVHYGAPPHLFSQESDRAGIFTGMQMFKLDLQGLHLFL